MKSTTLLLGGAIWFAACAPTISPNTSGPEVDPLGPENMSQREAALPAEPVQADPQVSPTDDPCTTLECGAPCQSCEPGDTSCEPRTCNSMGQCSDDPPSCETVSQPIPT
jgi:hypothetical protein